VRHESASQRQSGCRGAPLMEDVSEGVSNTEMNGAEPDGIMIKERRRTEDNEERCLVK